MPANPTMALSISDGDLTLVTSAENALVLGIITEGKEVKLRVADPIQVPGHNEWLKRQPIPDAYRGFSLLVKRGLVTALFPASILNPGPDCKLEDEFAQELRRLLPLAFEFRVLGS